ncbi:hypothetical protein BMF94_3636 [Rhodotorula taiwanensis]|uniref:Major facilitator superfamily (MFS) profile domain-containing protein n=1 Tax=Rhodotorula taiwanensis TaxID=741276 RepID=A0A2S5B951_9BASI|nr:hypothetical protein BMF94_3636 [Rhodotorula taiwanensis]
MNASISPRSSASEPLSPQTAAASLSWSPLPNVRDDEADVAEGSEAEGEGDLTPALVRVSLVAGLGARVDGSNCSGFDTGVTSSALLAIGTALGGTELSLGQQTGIVVAALWGALAGSLVASRTADMFGRRPVIIAAAVLFLLGALEQAAAQVYKEVILGRVLVGVGVGLSSMTLPIYLAEIAPSKFRGRVVASLVVLITGGQVLAYIIGAAFFHVTKGWRWMFGLGAVPAGIQLLLSFSLPESPRYHVRKGRLVTATKTIQRLNPSFTNEAVQRRLLSLQREVRTLDPVIDRAGDPRQLLSSAIQKTRSWRLSRLKEGRLGRMWEDRANRRALLVAAAKIIHQTGLGQPAAFAIFVAVSNFVSTIVALRLIDRVGRRALLLRTLLGMIGGMALLSFAFIFIHLAPETEEVATIARAPSPWAFVAVFAMCIFCVSYALGIGNVAWVVQSEVFNQELRALGNGLATAVNWSANLVVSSTFLHLSHAATPAGAFGLYAIVACVAWLFTYLYLPETKGLSLDEVRALFERKVGIDRGPDPVSDRQPTGGDSGYYVVGDEDSSEPEDEAEEGGDPDRAISEPELAPSPNAPTKRASDTT